VETGLKIVAAPNALKGSLTAREAAAAIGRGATRAYAGAETIEVPVADGGDGLLDVWASSVGGQTRHAVVRGPRGTDVRAAWLWQPESRTAVVEVARASGLALLDPGDRDPEKTDSYGTGQLILEALSAGAKRLVVGLGGSATNDGGWGLLSALGLRATDAAGRPLHPSGGNLGLVERLDRSGMDPRLAGLDVLAACDVEAPLAGPSGAARVFAPQKGADPAMVDRLDAGLAHWGRRQAEATGRDVAPLAGAGAAGGIGGGLAAFLEARLAPGVDILLDAAGLDEALRGAHLAITAEGRLDRQTFLGKAPAGVGRRAAAAGVPCVVLAGQWADGLDEMGAAGITAAFSICDGPLCAETAMRDAAKLLEKTSEQVVRLHRSGGGGVKPSTRT